MKPYSNIEIHGTGSPVVFLHGYPLNRSLWDNQVAAMKGRHQVILVDLPGFGSSLPISSEQFPDMAAFASDVRQSLSASSVDDPIVMVGLSMGGYIALEFWRQFPEQLRGLVFCHTKSSADTPEAKQNRVKTAATAVSKGTSEAVAPMLEKLLSECSRMNDPALDGWLREVMFSVPPKTIEASLLAMANRDDFDDRLSQITTPSLVIAGTDDEIATTETMQKMSRGLPNSRFEVIHDAAHLSPKEQPDDFNDLLLEFLESL